MTDPIVGDAQRARRAEGAGSQAPGMLADVLAGLRLPEKRISSKFHYDERGSELFEEITRLDEYYPTRTERALLETWMLIWINELAPAALVELGAGNSEKSRIILDAMVANGSGKTYVPVDVSDEFLQVAACKLRAEYPTLEVLPQVADITAPITLPPRLPEPSWVVFLGSTLGNFGTQGAAELLTRIRARLRDADRFLLGVDLRPGPHKSAERIALAYNDAAGVTAAFSLNVLNVLNRELGSDFVTESFRHRAQYNVDEGRIETYLDSVRDQVITFPDGSRIHLEAGEGIRTEISCKYDRATVDDIFHQAGLVVDRWMEDEKGYFALVLGKPA